MLAKNGPNPKGNVPLISGDVPYYNSRISAPKNPKMVLSPRPPKVRYHSSVTSDEAVTKNTIDSFSISTCILKYVIFDVTWEKSPKLVHEWLLTLMFLDLFGIRMTFRPLIWDQIVMTHSNTMFYYQEF